MAHWLIDDTGEILPAASEKLYKRLGIGARTVADRKTFVVKDLGFVAIEQLPNGLMVCWRPTLVRRETFVAAVLFLSDQPDQRVIVSSFGTAWLNRLYPDVATSMTGLVTQFSTERSYDGGYFVARPRSVATLGSTSIVRRALEAATKNGMRYDPLSLWSMLQTTVHNRFMLLDPDSDRRRLRVMSVGSGYTKLTRKWMKAAKGTVFEDHPDSEYAQSAARGYWAAFDTGTPFVEDVDASLWLPSRGRTPIQYTRLVAPLDVAGKRRILSTSELIPTSPNRLQLASE